MLRAHLLNSEHLIFVYIVKQKQQQSWRIKKNVREFLKFNENRILSEAKFLILILNFDHPWTIPWGHMRSHTQFGFDRFLRLDTIKQAVFGLF